MAKITFIGAGSVVFTETLLGDIFSFPALQEAEICLMDIDPDRLRVAEIVANKVAATTGARPNVWATEDRKRALDGADYVINSIQVGGYEPGTVVDFEIPKKYGLRQTIADTLGIGGIMRALRTIPVMLDICRDMEGVCPAAQFLNYSNPMAMNCWAVTKATSIKTVGLCHSVQGTAGQLARDIGIPLEEINYISAGINHMAFYLRFERDGADLTSEIRKVIDEGRVPEWNRVRYEMFKRLGYFVTESSEHFSEYCPHFIRRDRLELISRFGVPLDEYIRRCISQIEHWNDMKRRYESDEPVTVRRSHEYGSYIINSMESGEKCVVYGNVPNTDLITNLPDGCCVEVPCLVDKNGVQPTRIGELPPQLAAYIMTNVNVQSLTVEAALTLKREHIYHAAMLDPHTAAELTIDEIWAMVDELIAAHGDYLPKYH